MKDLDIAQEEIKAERAKGNKDFDPSLDPAFDDKQVTEPEDEDPVEIDSQGRRKRITRTEMEDLKKWLDDGKFRRDAKG